MRTLAIGLVVALGGRAPSLSAQAPAASPADVGSIPAIVRAFYEVISGPPGAPRDWRRDSTLYMEGATFVAMDERDGKPVYVILTAEEYRRKTNDSFVRNGFFETEIGSRIERFGNVAQVRSVYETRRTADGPLTGRGVNYLMVFWDGTRWWISSAVWDDERPDNPIPAAWVGSFETAP
ncbi:MAG: hypothetical protein H6Q77_1063 [Gemmatimonadetes bacterium]|nr:hypothetical protein [Gemmatimonadota bacterium]